MLFRGLYDAPVDGIFRNETIVFGIGEKLMQQEFDLPYRREGIAAEEHFVEQRLYDVWRYLLQLQGADTGIDMDFCCAEISFEGARGDVNRCIYRVKIRVEAV